MKKLIVALTIGALSGIAGYKIGFTVSKKKYENLADEELRSMKQYYLNFYGSKALKENQNKDTNKPIDIRQDEVLDSIGVDGEKVNIDYGKQYRTTSEPDRIPGTPGSKIVHLKKEELDTTKPHVITPEDFEESEFECVTLFYTADKVLTDDDYNQLNNVGIVGGYPVLDQMGRYDADCLYVRDTNKGIDYEILIDERVYSKLKPLGVIGGE